MQYMQREEGASTSFAIFIISGDIVSGVFFFFCDLNTTTDATRAFMPLLGTRESIQILLAD